LSLWVLCWLTKERQAALVWNFWEVTSLFICTSRTRAKNCWSIK